LHLVGFSLSSPYVHDARSQEPKMSRSVFSGMENEFCENRNEC